MQKHQPLVMGILVCLIVIISACQSPAPITADVTASVTAPIATETEMVPTTDETNSATPTITMAPTPTEQPPIPCMIAFDSDRDMNLEIYTMGPDGSNQINLTQNPSDDYDPVWSPDGSQIAFVSNRDTGEGGGQFIFIMNSDGSEQRQLSHDNDSGYPDWSPDGTRIAYTDHGDIFIISADGSGEAMNLTNSPEKDAAPKFSPEGLRIAWLRGDDNDQQIFIMNIDGSDMYQVTQTGHVYDVEWTVDGRLFTHWDGSGTSCFNCVVNADGTDVIDGGGKGTIQEFLPFWTADGKRVEMVSGEGPAGDIEIFLVSESFPDLFMYLTNNPANDRNPDAPALCGPAQGSTTNDETSEEMEQPQAPGTFVIGYEDEDGNNLTPLMMEDLEQACNELQVQCVRGSNIADLADQNVDAILSFSSRWHVLGSYPQLHDAVSRGIPVFVMNAETNEQGAYNLSVENQTVMTSLHWMFKQMNEEGKFIYYNFGNSDYHQELIDNALADFPGIQATAMPAEFGGESLTSEKIANLISENPDLGAIWTDESGNDIFWGMDHLAVDSLPLTICAARIDILEAWKQRIEEGSPFECIAFIKPGGVAYEGVYTAYYLLSGLQINPDALGGDAHNTFLYSIPEITNDTLERWLSEKDQFRMGMGDVLELQPMSPDEIKAMWFINQ